MSRSRKKHSAAKICGRSNKRSKRFANRKFRRLEKVRVRTLDLDRIPTDLKEVSNVYDFSSDGLAHWMECPGPNHPNPYWTVDAWKRMLRK